MCVQLARGFRCFGKEQIHEPLRGGLWLMIGQPGSLVGLNDDVVLSRGARDEQIKPYDGNIERTAGGNRNISQMCGQLVGHIMQRTASV